MKPKASEIYVLGLDFGSDSVRAVLVDTKDGRVIGEGVSLYKRWAKGMFSDFSESRFRHHPLDYQESITEAVRAVVAAYPQESSHIAAMSIDTTASTPCFVDENLVPLSLKPEFAENPNAMFVLWKDHTATEDAAEFEAACNRSVPDYSMCSGNKYSPEAFWSKALHILRVAPEVRDAAFTMLELCDWLPAMLTGCHDINEVKMSHCCAAQKLLWNKDWGGFPPEEFFESIDPLLLKVRRHLPPYNYTPDCPAGVITHEWAERLGLPEGVIVGAGNIDSHSGSFGAGVKERTLIMSYGTSSAYTTVISHKDLDHVIEGVLGQVDGLIVPDLIGIENGLSAFGDVYAWFKRLVMEPVKPLILSSDAISDECKAALILDMEDRIMGEFNREAAALEESLDLPFATDFFNGRRAPKPDMRLWASIMGLKLASGAGAIFRALVEATAFASKIVVDNLLENGVPVDKIIAVGGIAQKSPFVVQMMADMLDREIEISTCKQAGALGGAIYSAVLAGVYPDYLSAQNAMASPVSLTYFPDKKRHEFLLKRFVKYVDAVKFTEDMM